MKYFLVICLIYLQFADLTSAGASEPYCIYNRTEYTYTNVTKTREVKLPKPWYKKLSKSSTKIEEYTEQEPIAKVTPIRGCCEGYKMSELQLCEPQCQNGCPENSKCVEPETCKCASGYFSSPSKRDGKHYCEPICDKPCPEHSVCVKPNECACRTGYQISEGSTCKPHCASGCPFGGQCVAANQCECLEGYKSDKGSCLPICSAGDQCKNGVCVEREKCECNFGFVINEVSQKCEPNLAIFKESETVTSIGDALLPEEEEEPLDVSQPEIATDIDTWKEDVDPSQVFDETFESTTGQPGSSTDSDDSTNSKCADDFVLYRGQCHPLKFAIDEIDCRIQPCSDPQAVCTENGTCTCREGFKMLKKAMAKEDQESSQQIVKPVCLSQEDYESLMAAPIEGSSPNKVEDTESSNIATILFIVVGVITMTGALIYLGLRVVRSRRGEMDVEDKQLECAYENRGCSDTEKSII